MGSQRVRHNSATEQWQLNKVFTGSRWQEKGLNEVCRDHGFENEGTVRMEEIVVTSTPSSLLQWARCHKQKIPTTTRTQTERGGDRSQKPGSAKHVPWGHALAFSSKIFNGEKIYMPHNSLVNVNYSKVLAHSQGAIIITIQEGNTNQKETLTQKQSLFISPQVSTHTPLPSKA